jgi:ribosomal protein S18 acetylase RimI-like enzyme
MATSRTWRPSMTVSGPFRARLDDIGELNEVFSEAFTDRYRRDGMVGVRVPFLNPVIWKYAIEDAAEGAMLWRDDRGAIVAFNMVHRSGTEGWMGPLAVRNDLQGHGWGKEMVAQGVKWLQQQDSAVIGLETMPRTMDNIGFYSRLGFIPGQLTLTVSLDASRVEDDMRALSLLSPRDRAEMLDEMRQLLQQVSPGYDYTREITLTTELELGDTHLLFDRDRLVGYALAHTAPLVEGRAREELRVLKLVVDDEQLFGRMARALSSCARRLGSRRVSFRMQGEYPIAYQQLIALGGHVRWTDLRMSLQRQGDGKPSRGAVLSNWEI